MQDISHILLLHTWKYCKIIDGNYLSGIGNFETEIEI